MGGVIFLPDGRDWSVSSSVFAWVVETLADRAQDPGLAGHLRTIADHNLGSLALEDVPPWQRAELGALIRQLPWIARAALPVTSSRDTVVAQISELADLVEQQG